MSELNKQEQSDSGDMPYRSYFDHPSIDLMERFVLHRSSEEETELIEAHMFACESCASVRENLEVEIETMKTTLREFSETKQSNASFWKNSFSFPALSWAAAGMAACAICLFTLVPANIELEAARGTANIVVPEWRNTHLILRDDALQPGPLQAEIADETGSAMWSGTVNSANGQVTLALPRMTHAGHYYARLYTPGTQHELLSEFPFEVKFQL